MGQNPRGLSDVLMALHSHMAVSWWAESSTLGAGQIAARLRGPRTCRVGLGGTFWCFGLARAFRVRPRVLRVRTLSSRLPARSTTRAWRTGSDGGKPARCILSVHNRTFITTIATIRKLAAVILFPRLAFVAEPIKTSGGLRFAPKIVPAIDRGGNIYVFTQRRAETGSAEIELVALQRFVDKTLNSAATQLARKDYEAVIKECGAVIRLTDSDARIFNYRGRARYLLKLYDAAIEDFTRAIALDADEAIYHSNRGFSFLGAREVEKALADFEVALRFKPDLANALSGRRLAIEQREFSRATDDDRDRERKPSSRLLETRLDVPAGSKAVLPLPKDFMPFITPEAFHALETFRLGSKVDFDENRRLQVAYDRAYEEGRYIDAQEANLIRAIEREPVAALWKMLSHPSGNHYYLPKFTPVEERLNGLKRPLVGRGSDKSVYVKSDDDLAGLRVAIRRPPEDPEDGGLETAAIIPFRWVKGAGVVPLSAPDNLRVMIQLRKGGDSAMLGMSFSLIPGPEGSWDLRPEIYTSPKFGDDRFKAAASTVASPRSCVDCHAQGFNLKASKFLDPTPGAEAKFAVAVRQMPGASGFLDDMRKKGATQSEINQAELSISRPDVQIASWRGLQVAVVKLWNAIYYANQPYLDDADSRFVEYHDRYGSSWLDAGDLDRALDHFKKASVRRPEVAEFHLKIGRILLRKKRLDEALHAFDQAVRVDPTASAGYLARAEVHAAAGRYSESLTEADRAVSLNPGTAAAYLVRGEIRALVGEYGKALADCDAALQIDPKLAEAHDIRARILAAAPDPAIRNGPQAIAAAMRACELANWTRCEYLETLAAAYAEAGQFKEAVEWQEKAIADRIAGVNDAGDERQRQAMRERLELYRADRPRRLTPMATASGKPR